VSGFLLERSICVETHLGDVRPDIWTIILAASGAGKTFTKNKITKGLSEALSTMEFDGTGIVSAAAFVQALAKKPRGLWIRDEWAQYMQAIEQPGGPMSDMRDYLLRLHDNADISRETKKETITIESPALTILGLTVIDTFHRFVTIESMLDGTMQRFGVVVAHDDPTRHFLDYPLWDVKTSGWEESWKEIVEATQPKYFADPDMMQKIFGASYQALYNEAIPESFYRRILWKAIKYALIYHVIRADSSPQLNSEDFGWAARVVSMHIDDSAWLIGDHSLSGLERILARADEINARCIETKGRPATARDLIAGIKNITSAQQANQILSMTVVNYMPPRGKIGGRPEGF
ncbi:MAG: hypothetical protein HQK81_14270, partial [Desulfovibrionaceae bacterium]|nr:hypothetical protein [Desulfovibrionaceae bacterium]